MRYLRRYHVYFTAANHFTTGSYSVFISILHDDTETCFVNLVFFVLDRLLP